MNAFPSIDDAMLAELRAQTAWLRLLGLQALRPLLTELLRTEKQRAVYDLSDGTKTVRDVAREAGVGSATVARLWAEWISVGACMEAGRTGRAKHFGTLGSLGLASAERRRPPPTETGGETAEEGTVDE